MFENEESSTPEQSGDNAPSESPSQGHQAEPTAQDLIDLEKVGKFRFEGREWTPKDFRGAFMMQADYTRKTQQLAEERKYFDNLNTDLAAVKANPNLADKFREVYPAKYHAYLDYVTQKREQQTGQQGQNGSVDPEFMRRFNMLESEMNARKVEAINAELDARFKVLSEKYPLADEEAAIARAQALHSKGIQLTDKIWDQIWKAVSDKNEMVFKKYGASRVNQQKTANQRGRDTAPGGGIPGQAPKKPKTIKEASALALEEMRNL